MAHYDCSCCGESYGISHDHCEDCKAGLCHRARQETSAVPGTSIHDIPAPAVPPEALAANDEWWAIRWLRSASEREKAAMRRLLA